ncbi:hypothetical protein PMAYCL1PPCAC_14037, partial [Pristionchus mayeri]
TSASCGRWNRKYIFTVVYDERFDDRRFALGTNQILDKTLILCDKDMCNPEISFFSSAHSSTNSRNRNSTFSPFDNSYFS